MDNAKLDPGYKQRKVTCIDCGGTGVEYPQHSTSKVPMRCRTCKGVGYHYVTVGGGHLPRGDVSRVHNL